MLRAIRFRDKPFRCRRGFSAKEVQRLILIVGGLVFVTAACFFVFGAVSAAAVVNVLQRPLVGGSSPADAQNMAQKLTGARVAPAGTTISGEFFRRRNQFLFSFHPRTAHRGE